MLQRMSVQRKLMYAILICRIVPVGLFASITARTDAFTHEVAEMVRSVQSDVKAVNGITQEGARRDELFATMAEQVSQAISQHETGSED